MGVLVATRVVAIGLSAVVYVSLQAFEARSHYCLVIPMVPGDSAASSDVPTGQNLVEKTRRRFVSDSQEVMLLSRTLRIHVVGVRRHHF